ncbi:MAG: hypothetical protein NC409_03860 [Clostridium sp.]|nr:hypothetical protein [Clostridium sp.]
MGHQKRQMIREVSEIEKGITVSGQLQSMAMLLEEYGKPLITEDETKMAIVMPRIAQVMNLMFPMIVQDYTLSPFADRQEELSQWTGLLAQILETLEGRDTFAKIDVIYAVLLPNLTEHIAVLQEHGL